MTRGCIAILLTGAWLCPLLCPAQNPSSLKIGATLALSGRYAFIGEAERDGLLLGIERENRAGGVAGRPLELIVEDNSGETKNAVASVSKLVNIDKVDIVFSAFTHITRAVQPIVSRSGRFLLYASSVREMAEQNERVFRDYLDIQDDGQITAEYIAKIGHKRISYMRDESDVCGFHEQAFMRAGGPMGLELVSREEFISGDSDLRTLLLRLYSKPSDVVLFCAWRDSRTIMQQLDQLGLLTARPLVHSLAPFLPVADTTEMRRLYENSKSVTTWYGFIEGSLSAEQGEFVEAFKQRFGRYPRPDAAFAFDDALVLAQALRSCDARTGEVNYECLSQFLHKIDHAGAAGRLRFNAKRVSSRPVFLMTVEQGKWKSRSF